jgi:ABC-type methionine transport system ATPase subunit
MSVSFRNVSQSRTRPGGETLQVLDGVSFSIERASRVAIIGPSGGGKTTLLRLINRLDDPESGQILLNGIDIRELFAPDLRRRVGMVFQQPFLSDATVRENLNRPLSLAGRDDLTNDAAEAALRQVNLPVNLLDVSTRELSVGQQQRVAIARALVLQPGVLLLDEPTSALDLRSAEFILRLLSDLAESFQIMVIMVSHTIEQAAAFADRVLAVRDGQVKVFDDLSVAVDWSMPAEARESE